MMKDDVVVQQGKGGRATYGGATFTSSFAIRPHILSQKESEHTHTTQREFEPELE